jgi:hypothetical protein
MAQTVLIKPRRFAPPSPVHADQDSGRGRFGVEATAEVTATGTEAVRKYGPIFVAEIVVITFQKRRPLRREPPFNATTSRPACSGLGGAAKVTVTNYTTEATTEAGDLCLYMTPDHAALGVE